MSADLPSSTPPRRSCIAATPPRFDLHIQTCAAVVVEGATMTPLHMEPPPCSPSDFSSTPLASALFCWLMFTLAVYALPFFVALNAGFWAYHSGAGVLGTPLVAIAAGGMTLAIAQIAFAMTRSLILRAIIAAVFALPATLAGYHVALAMAQIGVPSPVWQRALRLPRRGLHRRHSMDAIDHLHRAPPARFGQGSRQRSSTSSHSRSASEMILHHPVIQQLDKSSRRKSDQRA